MLKYCCCCFSLRTGVFIIGIIEVILSTFGIVVNYSPNLYIDAENFSIYYYPVRELLIATNTFLGLNLAAAKILLLAAAKRNRWLLLPKMLMSSFTAGYVIVEMFKNKMHPGILIIISAASIYQFLILYSFEKELKHEHDRQLAANFVHMLLDKLKKDSGEAENEAEAQVEEP